MRGRADGGQNKRLVTLILVLVVICGVLYVFSQKSGSSALEYGNKSLKKFSSYLGSDDDVDDSPSTLGEDGDVGFVPKSFPVSYCMLE